MVTEEVHRRSPALRLYRQDRARNLFEGIGFARVDLCSPDSFEPAKADASGFMVVGHKAG